MHINKIYTKLVSSVKNVCGTALRTAVFIAGAALIAACANAAGADTTQLGQEGFVAVSGISGIPEAVQPGTHIDLAAAQVEPSTATVQTITWNVAEDSGATIDGHTVTAPGSEGNFVLTATVAKGGKGAADFTQEFTVEVAADAPEYTGTPTSSLTADVAFSVGDMDIVLDAVNVGKAAQTIGLSLDNADTAAGKKAQFTVIKTAAQSVSVGGADATSVSIAAAGKDAEVSVDLNDFTTMFEGRTYDFTLTVSESGNTSKTYTMNLDAQPDLSGAAIFVVTRKDGEDGVEEGTLTRITEENVADYLDGAENVSEYNVPLAKVDSLTNAWVWVDHNAKADTEYLIRVEASEALLRHNLSCLAKENVIVRLRGVGGERVLTYDRSNTNIPANIGSWKLNKTLGVGGANGGWGLLNVGFVPSSLLEAKITLQIEKNITVDGEGIIFPTTGSKFLTLIYVNEKSVFIMEEGSKLTGFKPNKDGETHAIVRVNESGLFWMKGGILENSHAYNAETKNGFICLIHGIKDYGTFKKTGGTFNDYGNKTYAVKSDGARTVPLASDDNDIFINKANIVALSDK